MEAIDLRDDLGLGLLDPGAHLAQPAKVLFESPRADVVAAWPRHPRLPEAGQQCAKEHDRRTHSPPEVVGHVAVLREPCLDDERALALDAAAEARDDLAHQRRVRHPRHVVEADGLGGQERGRHLRQGGILGAAHADVTRQLSATRDAKDVVEPGRWRGHSIPTVAKLISRAAPWPVASAPRPSPARSGTRSLPRS